MTCRHVQLITYCDAETGEPVPLWACTECKARFVPITELIAAEAEVAKLREALREVMRCQEGIAHAHAKPGWEKSIAAAWKQALAALEPKEGE